jgi:hypothetical protein
MTLHLIKLCVGCDSIEDLASWQAERLKARRQAGEKKPRLFHRTFQTPKRRDELLDGGSLYWVIRGQVMCRERILDIRAFVDKDGIGRCRVVLDGKIRLVAPRPYRAFQGWRYLADNDAPGDLERTARGAATMPEQMRRELSALGLL